MLNAHSHHLNDHPYTMTSHNSTPRPFAPSPHSAASCIANCEPGLRDFLRRSTRTQQTVSDARVSLDRLASLYASGGATPAKAGEVALAVGAHLERLEGEIEAMRAEITGLRETTIREIYNHCAPAHHPVVSGLHHLIVRPPVDPSSTCRPHDRH